MSTEGDTTGGWARRLQGSRPRSKPLGACRRKPASTPATRRSTRMAWPQCRPTVARDSGAVLSISGRDLDYTVQDLEQRQLVSLGERDQRSGVAGYRSHHKALPPAAST